jgi:hypothetical protein
MVTTNYEKPANSIELSESDKQRMACLYEEVQGRLKEMSLIVARTLNMEVSERSVSMMRPIGIDGKASEKFREGHVEVHCTQYPDGHYECGCYDYDTGTCGPC